MIMSGHKCNISLIIILGSLFSIQAFSQQIDYSDSIASYTSPRANLKPGLHYSIGSSFVVVPQLGNFTEFTVSPYLSIPLTPKLSVDGGIIAGRSYSSLKFNPEGEIYRAFNNLSVYGSASYYLNSQLTLYGTGIRQLSGESPFYSVPKSSYTFGSNYNFGSFSIGVAVQMSKWDNAGSHFPIDGSRGFYSPFEQRPGIPGTFDR
jgi:hypothetical protein